MAKIDPAISAGIYMTARSLGIDPVDLATAISYETAGTFNPKKAGPKTKWGRHRGLIQFGESQAKQYGVDWNDPIKSQLGPNGAVAKYLRDNGVRPGMGLLDIYSAINAGEVGMYNRSDEAAGGAPGTVRDKVEKQMKGHRRKAAHLLGRVSPAVRRTSQAVEQQPPLEQRVADWNIRPTDQGLGPAPSNAFAQPGQLGDVIVHTPSPNNTVRFPEQRANTFNEGPLPAHTLAELERYRANPGPAPSGAVMAADRPNVLGTGPRGWM